MPARPLVPAVVQVLWKGYASDSVPWLNKFFVRYTGAAPTAADLDTYALNVMGDLVTNLTPLQSSAVALTEVEATDLASSTGAVGVFSATTAGTRTGTYNPNSAAVLASWHVARHYRGGHPRTYVIAGSDTDIDTGTLWNAGFTTAVHTALLAMVTSMLTAAGAFTPSAHVNVSYFGGAPTDPITHKSIPRVSPQVDVISPSGVTVSLKIASQRRRLGRR